MACWGGGGVAVPHSRTMSDAEGGHGLDSDDERPQAGALRPADAKRGGTEYFVSQRRVPPTAAARTPKTRSGVPPLQGPPHYPHPNLRPPPKAPWLPSSLSPAPIPPFRDPLATLILTSAPPAPRPSGIAAPQLRHSGELHQQAKAETGLISGTCPIGAFVLGHGISRVHLMRCALTAGQHEKRERGGGGGLGPKSLCTKTGATTFCPS